MPLTPWPDRAGHLAARQSIVIDLELDARSLPDDLHDDVPDVPAVLEHVGQAFLDDPVQGQLRAWEAWCSGRR